MRFRNELANNLLQFAMQVIESAHFKLAGFLAHKHMPLGHASLISSLRSCF
jgi:hypothetical protein